VRPPRWEPDALPSQHGKTFVVTGGNAGLGYFASEQLAGAGAKVVLASRSEEKAHAAVRAITDRVPGAEVSFVRLDLASLDSVRDAADELSALARIDGLIENAGVVMAGRERQQTADGFELMFGTNHLGHFALTAHLFPRLLATPGARIVTLGSGSTRMVRVRPDDLQSERSYSSFGAYGRSKHATQAFGFELDRRIRAAGLDLMALVAHPGSTQDGLSPHRTGVNEPSVRTRLRHAAAFALGGSKVGGAHPIVRAATDPDATGGQYWGRATPIGGRPVLNTPVASSHGAEFGRHLWDYSERATGVRFEV
jgi:NAD(P)-dependent dehydrogenase (short-subunit alcohol dehydrogenase family)